jgi:hypothetical protein
MISDAERRAAAERTVDRLTPPISKQTGAIFRGRIGGVSAASSSKLDGRLPTVSCR